MTFIFTTQFCHAAVLSEAYSAMEPFIPLKFQCKYKKHKDQSLGDMKAKTLCHFHPASQL